MLITLCPHCQTRFRVTTDQLLQRNGTVRCGACHEIFHGGQQLTNSAENQILEPVATTDYKKISTVIEPVAVAVESKPDTPVKNTEPTMLSDLDTLSQAITDWQDQPRPTLNTHFINSDDESGLELNASHEKDQPGFVQQALKKQRRNRIWKSLLWIAIPLLLIALAIQLSIHFRNEIAASVPEADPYLRAACAELGCTIKLPAHIKSLSLQSSQLKTVSAEANQLELIALMRNQSNSPQEWPSLELQLKDESGQVMTRRVFLPASFVGSADKLKRGFAPNSEHEIRILFELAGGSAADFQLTMFYH
jgi:predicted Zn finger-like uncharacterized protein